MRAFLLLTRMRVLDIMRSRSAGAFFLIFPVVLLVVVGLVFVNGHPFERRRVVVVDAPTPAEAVALAEVEQLLRGYDEMHVDHVATTAEAEGLLRARMATAILTVGEPGGAAPLRLAVGPHDTLFGLGVQHVVGDRLSVETRTLPRFGYVHFLFPGLLTFAILFAGLMGMGYAMVRFRQSLFLKKLATTPLSRATFVAAQLSARTMLVLAQMVLLVIAAILFFDLPGNPVALAWLAVICVLGLATFMGVGFTLACVVRTGDLMVDVISAVTVPLIFLSELFFPVDELPAPLPQIAAVLPSTIMVRLTRSVLLYGVTDPATLIPGLLWLLGWAVVSYAVALRFFRWHG